MAEVTTNIPVVITALEALLDLFTVFPINIILVGTIAGVGFGLFRKAKKAAK